MESIDVIDDAEIHNDEQQCDVGGYGHTYNWLLLRFVRVL